MSPSSLSPPSRSPSSLSPSSLSLLSIFSDFDLYISCCPSHRHSPSQLCHQLSRFHQSKRLSCWSLESCSCKDPMKDVEISNTYCDFEKEEKGNSYNLNQNLDKIMDIVFHIIEREVHQKSK